MRLLARPIGTAHLPSGAPGEPSSATMIATASDGRAPAKPMKETSPASPASSPERPGSLASRGAVPAPAEALAHLLAGNRRFASGQPVHGHDVSAAAEAAASGDQQPDAVVIGCIDSRVPLEAIFDQTFGSICVARSGGHVLDRALLGSVQFAVVALGVPLVLVLGHERCGAVASAVAALRTGQRPSGPMAYLVEQIAPAALDVGVHQPDAPAKAMRRHVDRTVAALGAEPALAEARRSGRLDIVGAVYDLATGLVGVLD
jgi:carbonic anhydrase